MILKRLPRPPVPDGPLLVEPVAAAAFSSASALVSTKTSRPPLFNNDCKPNKKDDNCSVVSLSKFNV